MRPGAQVFEPFTVLVPCASAEITHAELGPGGALGAVSAASASGLSVAESEDEKLERLGVFEQMQPGHEIIYGVMTGGGMERSYGAIAASWCAGTNRACVYFSNVSTSLAPTDDAQPPPSVRPLDIAQEMIEAHGYPLWTARNETYWPVYRAAQLRFLPALEWLRQRLHADPTASPKTAAYFGSAKWVAPAAAHAHSARRAASCAETSPSAPPPQCVECVRRRPHLALRQTARVPRAGGLRWSTTTHSSSLATSRPTWRRSTTTRRSTRGSSPRRRGSPPI